MGKRRATDLFGPAGIRTHLDLPLGQPRGLFG